MPDFDVDFCMEGRDRVIEYVANKYGRERVSQIITYGTLAAKAVVRDVGRVLGHNYGYVDKIAKLIPFEIGMTLDKALEQEEELKRLYEDDAEVRELIDLARTLEGLARNAGTHAGGVVIAPSVLTDFTPLYCEEGGSDAGHAVRQGRRRGRGAGEIRLPGTAHAHHHRLGGARHQRRARERGRSAAGDERPARWTMRRPTRCSRARKTTAVFQLESRGMKDLIRRLQPDRFGDIVALVALFRPGPLQSGMVDDFIARKHDTTGATIDYLHPDLKPVLEATYGVILYQEQVMQIAQILAGYTLGRRGSAAARHGQEESRGDGEAALGIRGRCRRARRARSAGDAYFRSDGEIRRLRLQQIALRGVCAAVLPDRVAEGALSGRLHGGGAVFGHGQDRQGGDADRRMRGHGARRCCRPMSTSRCMRSVSPGPLSIRYGMGAIKGVGASAVEAIIEERTARGPFESLPDLCRRIDLQRVNRRVFEALIRSGSLDRIGPNRATLTAELDRAMHLGEQNSRAMSVGQVDLFGLSAASEWRR